MLYEFCVTKSLNQNLDRMLLVTNSLTDFDGKSGSIRLIETLDYIESSDTPIHTITINISVSELSDLIFALQSALYIEENRRDPC